MQDVRLMSDGQKMQRRKLWFQRDGGRRVRPELRGIEPNLLEPLRLEPDAGPRAEALAHHPPERDAGDRGLRQCRATTYVCVHKNVSDRNVNYK